MGTLMQDIRYGIRMLAKNPGFTTVAILTLALGIGANTAIFSIINTVLLAPLPYSHPDRLVNVYRSLPQQGISRILASLPEIQDWKQRNKVFENVDGFMSDAVTLSRPGDPQLLNAADFTSTDFRILGVNPKLGRTFTAEEDAPGGPLVVILSDALWRKKFGTDPSIIGKTIPLNDSLFTVIGVMPPEFQYPNKTDLWLPLYSAPSLKVMFSSLRTEKNLMAFGRVRLFGVLARLKQGETFAHAEQQMDALARIQEHEQPAMFKGFTTLLMPLRGDTRGVQKILLMLFGAVGFVLLIACANLANLSLARATGRRKEIAIRAAVGGSRARLCRQFFTESTVLALLGGAAGWLLATITTSSLINLLSINNLQIAISNSTALDRRVLIFTTVLSVLVGIGFGFLPALRASQADPNEALKESGRGNMPSARERRIHGFFIVSEIALALVLLAGAGLLIGSFARVLRVDMGFNPKHLLVMEVDPEVHRYPYENKEKRLAFAEEIVKRLQGMPGVRSVSMTDVVPLARYAQPSNFEIAGKSVSKSGELPQAAAFMGYPGYFQVMGIPLLKGRDFATEDRVDSPRAIIVNQELARRYFGKEDPLGKSIVLFPGLETQKLAEIVGVIGNVKSERLEDETRPAFYWSYTQPLYSFFSFVVRTEGDPEKIKLAAQKTLWSIDPQQPVMRIFSMEEALDETLATRRTMMYLLAGFAAVALILAAIGIYGVLSYWVTQRTHEIGVRMTLGAQRKDMLRLVLGQGIRLAFLGVGIGGVAAFVLTRFIASELFGVTATDPLTFVGVAVLLALVALAACYIPARRAMRVDPMVALRYE